MAMMTGVIVPPRVAPTQVVILPIIPKDEVRDEVLAACQQLAKDFRSQRVWNDPVRVEVDERDLGGGVKNWEWIKKGVPVRVEIGPRDLEKGSVAVTRRDGGHKDKSFIANDEAVSQMPEMLQSIQDNLLARALAFREEHTREIQSADEFHAFFTPQNIDKPEFTVDLRWDIGEALLKMKRPCRRRARLRFAAFPRILNC